MSASAKVLARAIECGARRGDFNVRIDPGREGFRGLEQAVIAAALAWSRLSGVEETDALVEAVDDLVAAHQALGLEIPASRPAP